MRRLLMPSLPAGVVVGVALLVGTPAYAAPGVCTSTFVIPGPGFSQNFTVNAGGTTVTPAGGSGVFNCVQQEDNLFSAFNFGAFPGSAAHDLSFGTVAGTEIQTFALAGSGFVGGQTYTVSYNVQMLAEIPRDHLISSSSGILQSAGVSSLAETLADNDGDHFAINFTETNATPNSGSLTGTALDPAVDWVDVIDKLTLSMTPGSNVTAITNSFVESEGVPEPVSLSILGAGMAGLGLARRRRRN